MKRELREVIDRLIHVADRALPVDEVDEDSSVFEIKNAVIDFNDQVGELSRLAHEARRQLDFEDLREYQASRAASGNAASPLPAAGAMVPDVRGGGVNGDYRC